jgi:ABC-type multidrug transport system permease subunit
VECRLRESAREPAAIFWTFVFPGLLSLALGVAFRTSPGAATAATAPAADGVRYIDFLVPGLLGMNLMGGGVWGIGWVIVENRIRKLLRLQLTTPMRRRDFLLAHVLTRCAFVPFETIPLILFSRALFGVTVSGSYGALVVVAYAGAFAFAGIGLLIASRVTTNQGAMGFINLVTLPMYVLSGVFFASTRFPAAVQPLLKALPLTALVDALRGVMNHGATLLSLAPQLAVLAAWGILSFLLALRLFRWS